MTRLAQSNQFRRLQIFGAGRAHRLLRLHTHRVALELGYPVIRPPRLALVTIAVQPHQKAITIGRQFLKTLFRHHHRGFAILRRTDKHIGHTIIQARHGLDKNHTVSLPRFAKHTGLNRRCIIAAIQSFAIIFRLAGGPRRQAQRQHSDGRHQWHGKHQHRRYPACKAYAAGKPHHHFRVAISTA